MSHLTQNTFLRPSARVSSGFFLHYSTPRILQHRSLIRKEWACGQHFFYFFEVFDVLLHSFFNANIGKLKCVYPNVHQWILQSLSYRKRSVLVNGVKSSKLVVTSCVPEFSSMPPIIFKCHHTQYLLQQYFVCWRAHVWREVQCDHYSVLLQEAISQYKIVALNEESHLTWDGVIIWRFTRNELFISQHILLMGTAWVWLKML